MLPNPSIQICPVRLFRSHVFSSLGFISDFYLKRSSVTGIALCCTICQHIATQIVFEITWVDFWKEKPCFAVTFLQKWRGMLGIPALEKASISITSSATETNNICLVEHESRILAQRPKDFFSSNNCLGYFFNLRCDLPTSEHHWTQLIRWPEWWVLLERVIYAPIFSWYFRSSENVWREFFLTRSSCLLMQDVDFLLAADSNTSIEASWVFPGWSIQLPFCLLMQVFYVIAPVRLTRTESSCSTGSLGGAHHLQLSSPLTAQENKPRAL